MRALISTLICALGALCASACADTPTSPTVAGPPYTVAFASTVSPGGTASRSLVAGGAGVITVTLDSTSPANLEMSIGVGIPTATQTGCSLTTAVIVTAGASSQLELAVDAGSYCVQVADPGRLAATASFAVTVSHP